MRRTKFNKWPCSIARTTDLFGDWWTPLVLREAFYGARRFDDFVERLGIGRNVLAARLTRLVEEGILRTEPYQERPVRNEYRLTDKGRALFGVLAAMIRWGDDWLAGEAGPPVELVDRRSGTVIRPLVADEATGELLDPRNLTVRPGPGFPKDQPVPPPPKSRATWARDRKSTQGTPLQPERPRRHGSDDTAVNGGCRGRPGTVG